MKKVLIALSVLVIVGVVLSGTALAKGRGFNKGEYRSGEYRCVFADGRGAVQAPAGSGWNKRDAVGNKGWNRDGRKGTRMGQKGGALWQNAPEEIRTKITEAAKLRIDLRDVMIRKPLDRAKALEIHGQLQKLNEELKTWAFTQRLDLIEKANSEANAPAKQ